MADLPAGRHAIAELSEVIAGIARGSLGAKVAAERIRAVATVLVGEDEEPEAAGPTTAEETATIGRVIDFWRTTCNHPHAKATPERKAKVRARLRDGYSENTIKRAIRGCARSDFHTGKNEDGRRYDELTLILRNGSKLEQFVGYDGGGEHETTSPAQAASLEQVAALEKEIATALSEGDEERYARVNTRLRDLRGPHEQPVDAKDRRRHG